ncbi:hypothetical protein M3Y94_00229300 [Aphelenchoides besseyi]|nr:hypothetical protein M3Y94_00229300 [Aphelenchoides besseyi]KAI6236455.1 hypothetical protein M3Y95_00159500 [Aphelenchoides besseyi]
MLNSLRRPLTVGYVLWFVLISFLLVASGDACTPTVGNNPGTGTPSGCCPALVQTNTSSTAFADGTMTFAYDNNNCRMTVTATCASTQSNALNAAIVVNGNNFLVFGQNSVSFPGTCNGNNQWLMGSPPLTVQTIECRLSTQAG